MKFEKYMFALSYNYPNNRAYIVGGMTKGMKTYKNVEYFDIHDEKPNDLPDLNHGR